MTEMVVLVAVFFAVLTASMVVVGGVAARREAASRLAEANRNDGYHAAAPSDTIAGEHSVWVKHYFDVIRTDTNPDSLPNRLIRAGFFSPKANVIFQVVRAALAFVSFTAVFLAVDYMFPAASRAVAIFAALMCGGLSFFLSNVFLERMGIAKERTFRRLFPDFMDMLIICVDAGLSLEAAADRVSREFLESQPDFGMHLSIMMLEVRGGRPLREALANLGTRLRIDEARQLAVLFRQSEELGTSVTKTLRVYSAEMRQKRILRAEEKANALPVKMLFPLGAFLFPISIVIVMVPIVIRVVTLLKGLHPG